MSKAETPTAPDLLVVATPGATAPRSFSVAESGAVLTVRTDGTAAGTATGAAPAAAGTDHLTVFRVAGSGTATAVARYGLRADEGGMTLVTAGADPAANRPANAPQLAGDAAVPSETFSVGTPQGRGVFGLSFVDGALIIRPLNAQAANADSIGIDTRMITVTALVVAQQSLKVSPEQVRSAYIVNEQ